MASRSSNWLFCVYPESLPDDWLEIIEDTHVQCAISPLHDKDVNPTGEPKKPHYHVMVRYDSLKSKDQVIDDFTSKLNGTQPIVCQSVRGTIRYFTHADNPEKAQYDSADIKTFSSFDVSEINRPTDSQIYEMIKEIIKYVYDNQIVYYIDLLMMTMFDPSAPPLWGYTVAHNTTLFSGACESLRKKLRG